MTAITTGANPITDGVDLVQIVGLGVLALLPLITFSLVGYALGVHHRWDFVEGLFKACAALTFTLNVCVAAWYVQKYFHGLTGMAFVVIALAAIWYFSVGLLTLKQFQGFRQWVMNWQQQSKLRQHHD